MSLSRLIVFVFGLGFRQLRDDPPRAVRLGLRLLLRYAPDGVRRALRRFTAPVPRNPRRVAAELGALLTDVPVAPSGGKTPHQRTSAAKSRRVLHLVTNALPHTNAGYTVRTHKIALAQLEAGLDPHVVTRMGYPLTQGIPDTRPLRAVDGVPYHRLIPWAPGADLAADVRKNVRMAGALVERLRPAVLHAASNHLNAMVALGLRERYGLPVVYEVRGFLEDSWLSRDPAHSPDAPFYRLTRELETHCMAAADLVVTLGETMRDEIAGRGVDPDKIIVVANSVDAPFLEPLPDGTALRAELGFDPDAVVVGLTSTFYGYEGIDTLIEAVGLLRDRAAPVRLLLVGDGPERPALERRTAELGLDKYVVFTGRVPPDRVRHHHSVIDIFAVPRRGDRVCTLVPPLKPLEAMAGQIPVVASDVKALREVVEPGMTGELTLTEDPAAWANSLESLIYSPNRCREIGRTARLWVETERTWRIAATQYIEAYRKLGLD
jgi:glycosyltransferase involved in cell wall biosynthesis